MNYDLSWEFHTDQRAAFESEARRIIVRAGRRGGKGVLGARWCWLKAIENPGRKDESGKWVEQPVTLVTATTYKQLQDFNVTSLKKQMPPGFAVFKEQKSEFDCKNGHLIKVRSIDNYEALRGAGEFLVAAWLDEFGQYPNKIWDDVLVYIFMDNAAPALITGTPKGMNKFYEFHQRALDGKFGYETHHWTSYDNPWLLREDMFELDELPENIKRQEVYADFLDDLGGVFIGYRECVAGDLEEPQPNQLYVVGADLAKTHDFTVITVIKKSSRAVIHFERFRELDWEFQIAKIRAAAKRHNDATIWLDSTGLGDPVYDRLKSLGARCGATSLRKKASGN